MIFISVYFYLDVTFGEDDRIHWDKIVAYNESIVRRIVMNMLNVFPETFKTRVRTEKATYGLLQKIMFADDKALESLLRRTFK